MQRLRHARHLARLVLAWFALSLGVAIAAPVVHPQSVQWICSGSGGLALHVPSDDGGKPSPSPHTLDCPLCVAIAPPPPAVLALPDPLPLGHVLQPIPAARHAARIAAPLPARGPPAFFRA